MRELAATAQGETAAPIERCFDQLAAIDAYPSWYPSGVRHTEVLERGSDGTLSKVNVTLVLAQGPIQRDFTPDFAVALERPTLVELRRLPKTADDQEQVRITWRLTERGPELTALVIELEAQLDIPRFLPLGGIADSIANGFMQAALASLPGA